MCKLERVLVKEVYLHGIMFAKGLKLQFLIYILIYPKFSYL